MHELVKTPKTSGELAAKAATGKRRNGFNVCDCFFIFVPVAVFLAFLCSPGGLFNSLFERFWDVLTLSEILVAVFLFTKHAYV